MCGCIKGCAKCLCGCAIGILKIIIFVFNVFFWVTGCVLIGISTYLLIESPARDYDAILEGISNDMWTTALAVTLTVGILMFLAGCLGCCGSCKSDATMLCWYSIFMSAVFALQCTIGIYISIQVDEVNDFLGKNLEDQVKYNYTGEENDPMTEAWDSLQKNLECCGAEDYTDYRGSYYVSLQNNTVPESCCDTGKDGYDYNACKAEAAVDQQTEEGFLYNEGCYAKVSDWIDEYAAVMYIVIYIIAALEIACILIGFCTCCSIKRQKEGAV